MITAFHEITAKPFLKWAGGKGQLLPQIKHSLPPEFSITGKIEKYFEPFAGGGALFFWLSQKYEIKEAYLYDINPEIVLVYKTIKSRVQPFIAELKSLEKEYFALKKSARERFYYQKRTEYNQFIQKKLPNHPVRRAALVIFLNRVCFNGLFRVNSKGLFNVPFGRYENPKICDEKNLTAVSKLLKNTKIECRDFSACLKHAGEGSFVYFDPPYRPISKTASFTGYIKGGFNDDEQRRLKTVFDKLHRAGAKVMLSNSDPKNINPKDHFFEELYHNHKIIHLKATRMINSKASKRGVIRELLITNY